MLAQQQGTKMTKVPIISYRTDGWDLSRAYEFSVNINKQENKLKKKIIEGKRRKRKKSRMNERWM